MIDRIRTRLVAGEVSSGDVRGMGIGEIPSDGELETLCPADVSEPPGMVTDFPDPQEASAIAATAARTRFTSAFSFVIPCSQSCRVVEPSPKFHGEVDILMDLPTTDDVPGCRILKLSIESAGRQVTSKATESTPT